MRNSINLIICILPCFLICGCMSRLAADSTIGIRYDVAREVTSAYLVGNDKLAISFKMQRYDGDWKIIDNDIGDFEMTFSLNEMSRQEIDYNKLKYKYMYNKITFPKENGRSNKFRIYSYKYYDFSSGANASYYKGINYEIPSEYKNISTKISFYNNTYPDFVCLNNNTCENQSILYMNNQQAGVIKDFNFIRYDENSKEFSLHQIPIYVNENDSIVGSSGKAVIRVFAFIGDAATLPIQLIVGLPLYKCFLGGC